MEYSKIKNSLKKFGLNFNNKIVKAIEDLHKDSNGPKVIRCRMSEEEESRWQPELTDEQFENLEVGDIVIAEGTSTKFSINYNVDGKMDQGISKIVILHAFMGEGIIMLSAENRDNVWTLNKVVLNLLPLIEQSQQQ